MSVELTDKARISVGLALWLGFVGEWPDWNPVWETDTAVGIARAKYNLRNLAIFLRPRQPARRMLLHRPLQENRMNTNDRQSQFLEYVEELNRFEGSLNLMADDIEIDLERIGEEQTITDEIRKAKKMLGRINDSIKAVALGGGPK